MGSQEWLKTRKVNRKTMAFSLAVFVPLFCLSGGSCDAGEMRISPPQVIASPLFPCSQCHAAMEVNRNRRVLQFHTEVQMQMHGWCLDCHDPENRDRLRLVSGERIEFTELYRLCGQCHGNVYSDWKPGIHGKRTGRWDGEKQYYLCTTCHSPHSPRFKPLKPEPRPLKPEETLRR